MTISSPATSVRTAALFQATDDAARINVVNAIMHLMCIDLAITTGVTHIAHGKILCTVINHNLFVTRDITPCR